MCPQGWPDCGAGTNTSQFNAHSLRCTMKGTEEKQRSPHLQRVSTCPWKANVIFFLKISMIGPKEHRSVLERMTHLKLLRYSLWGTHLMLPHFDGTFLIENGRHPVVLKIRKCPVPFQTLELGSRKYVFTESGTSASLSSPSPLWGEGGGREIRCLILPWCSFLLLGVCLAG